MHVLYHLFGFHFDLEVSALQSLDKNLHRLLIVSSTYNIHLIRTVSIIR